MMLVGQFDIHQRINAGWYRNAVSVTHLPRKPTLLCTPVGELDEKQLEHAAVMRKQYEAERERHAQSWKDHRTEEARQNERFRQDCFTYFEMNPQCEMAQAIYAEAWDRGHSGGYSEVVNCLSNLQDLYNLHRKLLAAAA